MYHSILYYSILYFGEWWQLPALQADPEELPVEKTCLNSCGRPAAEGYDSCCRSRVSDTAVFERRDP